MIKRLKERDLNEILSVEETFIPPLRASSFRISSRLKMGHIYLGTMSRGKLVGTLAFRYARFDPSNFPETFHEFADSPNEENPNALFVYTLGVLPQYRPKHTMRLINFVSAYLENGITQAVWDGRCPTYNGSSQFNQERIEKNLKVRAAVDEAIKTGKLTEEIKKELARDSLLAFYHRTIGGELFSIAPNFIPEDTPSGGHRIIMMKKG